MKEVSSFEATCSQCPESAAHRTKNANSLNISTVANDPNRTLGPALKSASRLAKGLTAAGVGIARSDFIAPV